ncbi:MULTISPECIES: hypothetical protein [Enterobacter]|uniref:hypothetical protein n=1 Tax=Enterobacter TaxID=547 RepID=UPI0020052A3C|nr:MULTISPECIES: hypothetical protein [Enterobacter]MCK7307890.1 hypothetical protein [Enterobacter quasiroggenkampii]MEB6185344.1 hypothetical protein [Enterobacter roggenkampii]
MKKLSNTEIIDKLSKFRAAGDKISEDVFELSSLLLSISEDIDKLAEKTESEKALSRRLHANLQLIGQSILNAHAYNDSMWKDYRVVIKQLGGENFKANE